MKIAVCAHLYYVEMFKEISHYLENFENTTYDLYVTMPRENKPFAPTLLQSYPYAHIIYTENVGFDIYPFLRFVQEVDLDTYDILFKVHSKKTIPGEFTRNGVNLGGTNWRDLMFRAVLGSPARIQEILCIFERQHHVGMVCAEEILFQGAEVLAQDINLAQVQAYSLECGLLIRNWEFAAGSVFVVRPKLLKPLKRRNFTANEFPPYFPRDWNSLPYCLERIFGCMVSAQGLTLCGLPQPENLNLQRIERAYYFEEDSTILKMLSW